jgi:hypothetical protein
MLVSLHSEHKTIMSTINIPSVLVSMCHIIYVYIFISINKKYIKMFSI